MIKFFTGVIWTHIGNTLSNVRLTDTHHIHNISSSAQISISIYHLIHWRFLHMNWGFKMHDLPILAVIFLTLIRTPFYTFPTSKGRKWKGFHFYRGNDRNLKTINTKHSENQTHFYDFFFIFGFYFYRKWRSLRVNHRVPSDKQPRCVNSQTETPNMYSIYLAKTAYFILGVLSVSTSSLPIILTSDWKLHEVCKGLAQISMEGQYPQ